MSASATLRMLRRRQWHKAHPPKPPTSHGDPSDVVHFGIKRCAFNTEIRCQRRDGGWFYIHVEDHEIARGPLRVLDSVKHIIRQRGHTLSA